GLNGEAAHHAARAKGEPSATNHAIQPVSELEAQAGRALLIVAALQQTHHCPPDGACQCLAPKRAAMLTRLQNTEYVMISNDRGKRHDATAQSLPKDVELRR